MGLEHLESRRGGRLGEPLDRLPDAEKPANLSMRWGGHACNVTDPETFNRVVPAWLAGEPYMEE